MVNILDRIIARKIGRAGCSLGLGFRGSSDFSRTKYSGSQGDRDVSVAIRMYINVLVPALDSTHHLKSLIPTVFPFGFDSSWVS